MPISSEESGGRRLIFHEVRNGVVWSIQAVNRPVVLKVIIEDNETGDLMHCVYGTPIQVCSMLRASLDSGTMAGVNVKLEVFKS